jgi:hypothetical protein
MEKSIVTNMSLQYLQNEKKKIVSKEKGGKAGINVYD